MLGWSRHVTAVKVHYNLGMSPAAINPKTGILYINPVIWPKLTEDEKDFIIYHELGHLYGRTTNEILADKLAHKWYTEGKKGKKRTLKGTVFLMLKILPPSDPRIMLQLKRAQKTDKEK